MIIWFVMKNILILFSKISVKNKKKNTTLSDPIETL